MPDNNTPFDSDEVLAKEKEIRAKIKEMGKDQERELGYIHVKPIDSYKELMGGGENRTKGPANIDDYKRELDRVGKNIDIKYEAYKNSESSPKMEQGIEPLTTEKDFEEAIKKALNIKSRYFTSKAERDAAAEAVRNKTGKK